MGLLALLALIILPQAYAVAAGCEFYTGRAADDGAQAMRMATAEW